MSRKKAVLILDPNRRPEQMAYLSERACILYELGDQLWAKITEDQASRFAGHGIIAQFHEDADLIKLPAVVFNPNETRPEPPFQLQAAMPSGDDRSYFLVQFVAPTDPNWIVEIEELGGSYIQSLPVNVGLFRLTTAEITAVENLEFVSWVGLFHPAYALSYELAGRNELFSATELRHIEVDPSQVVATETGTLEITFFDDISTEIIKPIIEAAGAIVRTDTGYSLVVDIAPEKATEILQIEGVLSVEKYATDEEDNQRAGIIITTEQVRNFGNVDFLVNLDGADEIAGVIDSGLDTGGVPPAAGDPPHHPDLDGRIIQLNNLYGPPGPANPTADPTGHGTHMVGLIASNGGESEAWYNAWPGPGTNPRSVVRGIAPACHIIFYSVRRPILPPNPNPNPNALDFAGYMRGLTNAHNAGARIHSNSFGRRNISNNVYTNISAELDRFAFIHSESLVLFSAGNREEDSDNDGILDMRRLGPKKVTKNTLLIGASENDTNRDGSMQTYNARYPGRFALVAGAMSRISDDADDIALFSNRGRIPGQAIAPALPNIPPFAQQRIKPDLVVPGTNIISTGPRNMLPFAAPRRPTTAPPPFCFVGITGTSMSTAIATGAAVLTRQFYRARFGQLRRPRLLEYVNSISKGPPTAAPHRDGSVLALIQRDAAGQNHIAGARYDHNMIRQGAIMQLHTNVADQPVPKLTRHGDNTLLLHRASSNKVMLSLHDPILAPVNAFGSQGNGTVELQPASSPVTARPPALCVHGDEVAVVWNKIGSDDLLFQRFRSDTDVEIDAQPKTLGSITNTSPHPYITHNGTHNAVVWVYFDGTDYELQMRLINNAGVVSDPITLVTRTENIRDPHLVWDSRENCFLVVWVGPNERNQDDIYYIFVWPDGTPFDDAHPINYFVPNANEIRQPYIALHPDNGYVLLWADNVQNNQHDVCLTFLDELARPNRIPIDPTDPEEPPRSHRQLLRISDTPNSTEGFSATIDNGGIAIVWQSNDEINTDQLGVYALKVTPEGAFQAQVDPGTPLINSGKYVNHLLVEHNNLDLTSVSMVWVGGNYFLLRGGLKDGFKELQLVKTNADGLVDGSIALSTGFFFSNTNCTGQGAEDMIG